MKHSPRRGFTRVSSGQFAQGNSMPALCFESSDSLAVGANCQPFSLCLMSTPQPKEISHLLQDLRQLATEDLYCIKDPRCTSSNPQI